MVRPIDNTSGLALTMIGEARSEGDTGMIAVGCVVMNRAKKDVWYGRTPLQVCLKHSSTVPILYQFSCWNRDDPNREFIMDLPDSDPLYINAYGIAGKLLDGKQDDITNQATHYFRTGTKIPKWAEGKTPCCVIGHHEFFNNIE